MPHYKNTNNFIELPDGTRHYIEQPHNTATYHATSHPMNKGIVDMYKVRRNERKGFIEMPLLGSRLDDVFLSAVAKGTVIGQGLTPVVDGEASNVLRRLQMLVYDWVVSYKSKFKSAQLRFSEFLSKAEDGEGARNVLSNMIGGLMSQNTGYVYGLLPFHQPVGDWSDWGGNIIELEDGNYILDISAIDFANNRGYWSLDNLQVDPTGDPEFPLWVRKTVGEDNAWVLVHKNYCGQILGELGAKKYDFAGFWTCPLYTYFGEMGVMNAMLTEYNYEGFFNAPPEGMVVLTGADHEDQLANIMEQHLDDREMNNSLYYPGTVWVSIVNKEGQVFFVPFKKPSEGFEQKEFVKMKRQALALAFGLAMNFLITEIGVGAVHQAAVSNLIAEMTGIAFIRSKAEHLFNTRLAPRRVKVTVSIPSTAAREQQANTFEKVTRGIKTLQDAGADLSDNQVIRLTEKMTGNVIPASADDTHYDDTDDPDTILLVQKPLKIKKGQEVFTALKTKGVIVEVKEDGVEVEFDWGNHSTYAVDELWVKK